MSLEATTATSLMAAFAATLDSRATPGNTVGDGNNPPSPGMTGRGGCHHRRQFSLPAFFFPWRMGGCLLLLLLASCSQPDFYDTRGVGHRYADYDGKWLVINYWATWCAPCKTEIPELIALNRHQPGIVVLGVNYDQPGQVEMEKQIAEMGITFPVYQRDPYLRFGSRRPMVLPTTFIVSPDGNLVKVLEGPQTEASLLAVMGKPG